MPIELGPIKQNGTILPSWSESDTLAITLPTFGTILPEDTMNEDVLAVGLGIRAARRAARLSQRDLADLVGLSERTIRDIERGTGSPSVASVFAAANAVGLAIGVQ